MRVSEEVYMYVNEYMCVFAPYSLIVNGRLNCTGHSKLDNIANM